MIAYMGMSEKLPNLCYYTNEEYSFNRPYSEKTAELIDEEVKRMVNEQYDRAKSILSEYKDKHKELAELLISKEVIFAEDVEHIFGPRKWKSRSLEIIMDDKRQDDEKNAAAEEQPSKELGEDAKDTPEKDATKEDVTEENVPKSKDAPESDAAPETPEKEDQPADNNEDKQNQPNN
jgi:cell division protease FtsH